jgi:hypothetical protein
MLQELTYRCLDASLSPPRRWDQPSPGHFHIGKPQAVETAPDVRKLRLHVAILLS